MTVVVNIDQSTTSTQALLLYAKGKAKTLNAITHQQIYPQSGWVEHDPISLLNNVKEAIIAAGNIDALALTNQGESCLAWNSETGEPISNVIVWLDKRTESFIQKLKKENAGQIVKKIAELPLDGYFSATKFRWILDNIPKAKILQKQGKLRLGTTDAFFIEHLTGNFYTDISTASRTSLLNLKTGGWDPELCDLFGVSIDCLPEIKNNNDCFGEIDIGNNSIPLLVSIVDQQASLYGHCALYQGDTKITFGTGGFALSLINKLPNTVNGPSLTVAWKMRLKDIVYAVEGGIYCAGSALNWAKGLGLFSDFREINSFDKDSAISRDLIFVPALSGLGCPHWDNSASGMWLGMNLNTSASDLVQSIIEGIAFRASELINSLSENLNTMTSISIDGGMTNNTYFCQFLANILQMEVKVPSIKDLTSYGACIMLLDTLNADTKFDNFETTTYLPLEDLSNKQKKFSNALKKTIA